MKKGNLIRVFVVAAFVCSSAQAYFYTSNLLPPANGMYVCQAPVFAYFQNGIVIRNWCQRAPSQSILPPPPGAPVMHSFKSMVEFEISFDGGQSFQPITAGTNSTMQMSYLSSNDGVDTYDTEMLQLDISGGSLPPGVMIRESPTMSSGGQTTVKAIPSGYMIDSFFDIFTEVSTDGGGTWYWAAQSARIDLMPDPTTVAAIQAASELLPSPMGQDASTGLIWQRYASGIILRGLRHKLFGSSIMPPAAGAPVTHSFNSIVDFELSTDNGITYQSMRAPASASMRIGHIRTFGTTSFFDIEILSLTISGGYLPAGVIIRESPTKLSQGAVAIEGGGGGGGGYMVSSFFDIFTEVSTDGGGSFAPATNGPGHLETQAIGEEKKFPTSLMPPPEGRYYCPQPQLATFANGIVINGFFAGQFTLSSPLPPPGNSLTHSFGSQVEMEVSMDGGLTFNMFNAPASVTVLTTSTVDSGDTRYFDTEMLQLDISGGSLPPGIMIRESPTRASTGRTSVRTDLGGGYMIDSFFDIFTEVSTDGGQTWRPTTMGPGIIYLRPEPLTITCPPDMIVETAGRIGTIVTYTVTTGGGIPPITVNCNPPSGSLFPMGTTSVSCTAIDSIGQRASCSFSITVKRQKEPHFYPGDLMMPPNSMYLCEDQYFTFYQNGIVIRNWSQRRPTSSIPVPAPGAPVMHAFSSQVDFEISFDGGKTWQPVTALSSDAMQITYDSTAEEEELFQTEIIGMNISGGTLPGNVQIRESPTMSSGGQTTVKAIPGGYMIDSFFDIFTEVSTDGGMTWWPASQPGRVNLMPDPTAVAPISAASALLPSPMSQDVSTAPVWQSYPSGIILKDVRHKLFTNSTMPPAAGSTLTHTFDSIVDFELSTDGGGHWAPVRAPATSAMKIGHIRTFEAESFFDTEILSLNIAGGDLPAGVYIRESPTKLSQGAVAIEGGGGGGGYMVSSFFDIFTEVSTDGGMTWSPATNGPGHLETQAIGREETFGTLNMPPLEGEYRCPEPYLAYFADGTMIANFFERQFTQSFPLPPPGGMQTNSFNTNIKMLLSTNGGASLTRTTAPAAVTTRITSFIDSGSARYFDTEILQLDINGSGVMIRESPTRASIGRDGVRDEGESTFHIDSFFDIYIEVSRDGGMTWYPTLMGPAEVILGRSSCNRCSNLDKRGLIDLTDFAIMANNWQWVETPGDAVNMADNDCDGAVDMHDLAIFVDNWLQTCP
jgi:hypothetical protein